MDTYVMPVPFRKGYWKGKKANNKYNPNPSRYGEDAPSLMSYFTSPGRHSMCNLEARRIIIALCKPLMVDAEILALHTQCKENRIFHLL